MYAIRSYYDDYDEIAPMTECNFRRIPPPRSWEDEMSAEPYYSVGPHDVFPEQFAQFLVAEPKARQIFLEYHADLMDPAYWQARQDQLRAGVPADVFPYPDDARFPRRS